jgi:hypothetical protein
LFFFLLQRIFQDAPSAAAALGTQWRHNNQQYDTQHNDN